MTLTAKESDLNATARKLLVRHCEKHIDAAGAISYLAPGEQSLVDEFGGAPQKAFQWLVSKNLAERWADAGYTVTECAHPRQEADAVPRRASECRRERLARVGRTIAFATTMRRFRCSRWVDFRTTANIGIR